MWEAHGTDAPVHALARGTEFREVLLNLLENARLADARHVTVEVAREGDRVRIAVRDDGHGIAPDLHARIFEPHFSTRTSGSGLGLAISRRLIEGLKGRSCIAGFLSKPLRPVELARLLNEPVIPVVPPNQN